MGEILIDEEWFEEIQKRVEHQNNHRQKMIEVRQNNLGDDEKHLRSLDSALKKTTTFMKKIKNLTAASIPAIIDELSKLNLSKFVEEMAAAIIDTKLKLSDIPKVADLCVAISSKYSNFSEQIAGEFKKILPLKKSDKVTNAAKLRVDIIFLAELILCGVFNQKEGLQVLGGVLSYLVQTDKEQFNNVGLLCTVCRTVGWQIANIVPRPFNLEGKTVKKEEILNSNALSDGQKKTIYDLIFGYYSALYEKSEKACNARNKAFKRVKKQERTRGDANDLQKNELENCQAEFDKYRNLAFELSCSIGVEMKDFTEEESDDEEDEAANQEMKRALEEGEVFLWIDEETKYFYECLTNLRESVHEALFKESEKKTLENVAMETNIDEIDMENMNEGGEADLRSNSQNEEEPEKEEEPTNVTIIEVVKSSNEEKAVHWQKFLLDLDHLVNKSSTDNAAIFFVTHLNNKSYRKRLVKLMSSLPARMDLIPFYARLVATLENVMPDVVIEIVTNLLNKFQEYIQKKTNDRIEIKLACVLMISELMKFGIILRAQGLSCLRQLVYDFNGNSIEMLATMLESGGLYLYRHTDSHAKMKRLLEVVKSKRERIKDARRIMLIENAYFTCLPPEDSKREREQLKTDTENTPMKRFIQHIVIDINEQNANKFLKCFRRLDWLDKDIADYTLKYLSSPWLLPLENIWVLASTISGLIKIPGFEWIGTHILDSTIEIIRLSLEIPVELNQWALASALYLGEMYSYCMCEHDLILKVLYQLISFPETENSWRDMHRIRMVSIIVSTCGKYLRGNSEKTKLRYFMTYFHRYYLMKKENWEKEVQKLITLGAIEEDEMVIQMQFPFDVIACYEETVKNGGKSAPKTLKEAEEAVIRLEEKLKPKILKMNEAQRNEPSRRGSDELGAIVEEDEETELNRENGDRDENEQMMDDETLKQLLEQKKELQAIKEEEEEFQRNLDRLMGEPFRNPGPSQNASAVFDITLPSAVKNRFDRPIRFAEDTKMPAADNQYLLKSSIFKEVGKTDDDNDNEDEAEGEREGEAYEEDEPKEKVIRQKVTLLIRGKGNKAQLKTVNIADDGLREKWHHEKEKEKKEREDMKRLTLAQQQRIEMEEENKRRMQQLNRNQKILKKK